MIARLDLDIDMNELEGGCYATVEQDNNENTVWVEDCVDRKDIINCLKTQIGNIYTELNDASQYDSESYIVDNIIANLEETGYITKIDGEMWKVV